MAVTNLDEVMRLLGENAEVSVVGQTAFMVAAERALESEREECLIAWEKLEASLVSKIGLSFTRCGQWFAPSSSMIS